jgi:hypothetical protein
MQKIFRFTIHRPQKAYAYASRAFRKPVVFYNARRGRTQVTWMKVTTIMILFAMMIGDCGAPTLQEQLKASKELVLGDVTTLGVGGGTIVGAIIAIVRQSPALLFIVMGIGFGLSMYMKWIKDYNFGG